MKYVSLLVIVLLAACATNRKVPLTPSAITVPGKLFTTLYQQRAAEYRALCFQAYNMARWQIEQLPAADKPLAIITDIDETVLDNSPYAAHQALQGKEYESASWFAWTAKAACDTVPGAPSFFKYAAGKGITVFYITNREERERTATLQNLQRYGFPNADSTHLLLKQSSADKESRRQQVLQTHQVVLLIGDNLSDFFTLYKKSMQQREVATQQAASLFGNRFIALPNPVYGDWEAALLPPGQNFTAAQKDSVLKQWLKTY